MEVPSIDRIYKAIEAADNAHKPHRELRGELLRIYMGAVNDRVGNMGLASDGNRRVRRVVNLTAQTIDVLSAVLSGSDPRHVLLPKRNELSGEAMLLESMLDQAWIDQAIRTEVLEMCVFDALVYPMGIAMWGIKAGSSQVLINNESVDLGEYFIARIDPDDYGIDPHARTWGERSFEFHRFRVGRDYALECGLFAGKEEIIKMMPAVHNLGMGDEAGSRSSEMVSANDTNRKDPLYDQIELIQMTMYLGDDNVQEIIIPSRRVKTDSMSNEDHILQLKKYEGPKGGRYRILRLRPIPNNIMGTHPVGQQMDLANAVDKVAGKLINQMHRSKTIYGYARAVEHEALEVKDAPDGATVAMDDPKNHVMLQFGGVIEQFFDGLKWMMSQYNNITGNVQQLGGSGQLGETGTATEAQLLQNNANRGATVLDRRVVGFAGELSKMLAWSFVTDPLIQRPTSVRIPGGEKLDLVYDAATRRGGYLDFNYNILQDTLAPMDPTVRRAMLLELFRTINELLPYMQAGVYNSTPTLQVLGSEFGRPDLDNLVNDPRIAAMDSAMLAPTSAGAMPGMPQQPTTGPGAVGAPSRSQSPQAARQSATAVP